MSSYHTSFRYLDKNSYDDFNLQIVHFDGGDSGETDSYLSQDSIYADSPRGTKRTLYGTKYNSVATLSITVMRPDGSEFSIAKTREIYKWLTGMTQYNWMDLYVGDEVKYRMFCFVQNVQPYKIDSRVVGFTITVESNSPWCYSPTIIESMTVSGSNITLVDTSKYTSLNEDGKLMIDNPSDDLYTYTQMTTEFKNTVSNGSLKIINNTIGEIVGETTVDNLVQNEIITLSENMFIKSDKETRIFGADFNYIWPKLKPGTNEFTIEGTGELTFKYIHPIKVGDCVGDLNAASDPICDEDGKIILDTLDWNRIVNTPTTLSGYGITEAVEDKIDEKLSSLKADIQETTNNSIANFTSFFEGAVNDLNADIDKVVYDLKSEHSQIEDKMYELEADLRDETKGSIANFTSFLNGKVNDLENSVDSKITEFTNDVNRKKKELDRSVDDLSKSVDQRIGSLNNHLETKIENLKKEKDKDLESIKTEISTQTNKTLSTTKTEIYEKLDNQMSEFKTDVKNQINNGMTNIKDNTYTREQIDSRFENLVLPGDNAEVTTLSWYKITDKPDTISGYGITNVYTKTETEELISAVKIEIDEAELTAMLLDVLQ